MPERDPFLVEETTEAQAPDVDPFLEQAEEPTEQDPFLSEPEAPSVFGISEEGEEPAPLTDPVADEGIGRLESARSSMARGMFQLFSSLPKSYAIKDYEQDINHKQGFLNAFDRIDQGKEGRLPLPKLGEKRAAAAPPSWFGADPVQEYKEASATERLKLRRAMSNSVASLKKKGPKDMQVYKAAEAFDNYVARQFRTNPEYEEEFWSGKVPAGFGSMVGFAATGLLSRGTLSRSAARQPGLAKMKGREFAAATIAPGVIGSEATRTEFFEDAIRSGATIKEALENSNIGAYVGISEALPIGHLLTRLDKQTGGVIKRTLVNMAIQGSEEGAQEAFQIIMQNISASKIIKFDKNRKWWQGSGENAAVGFTTGALVEFLAAITTGGRRRGGTKTEQAAAAEEADAVKAEAEESKYKAEDLYGIPEEEAAEAAPPIPPPTAALATEEEIMAAPAEEEPTAPPPKVEYIDSRLKRSPYRDALTSMSEDLIKGGGVEILPDKTRTPSLNPQWFQSMRQAEKVTTDYVKDAVAKAIAGEKLGVKQKRVIQSMLDHVSAERKESIPTVKKAKAVKEAPGKDLIGIADTLSKLHKAGIDEEQTNAILDTPASDTEVINRLNELYTEKTGEKVAPVTAPALPKKPTPIKAEKPRPPLVKPKPVKYGLPTKPAKPEKPAKPPKAEEPAKPKKPEIPAVPVTPEEAEKEAEKGKKLPTATILQDLRDRLGKQSHDGAARVQDWMLDSIRGTVVDLGSDKKILAVIDEAMKDRQIRVEGSLEKHMMPADKVLKALDRAIKKAGPPVAKKPAAEPDVEKKRAKAEKARAEKEKKVAEKAAFESLTGSPELLELVKTQKLKEFSPDDILKAWAEEQTPPVDVSIFDDAFVKSVYLEAQKVIAKEEKAKIRATWEELLKSSFVAALRDAEIANVSTPTGQKFKQGWDHAIDNKTRSTLPQGDADVLSGYTAGRKWLETPDGSLFAKGKRNKKMASTGDALRRVHDGWKRLADNLDAIDASNHEQALKTIYRDTTRATVFDVAVPEDATPGTKVYIDMIRGNFLPFKEWVMSQSAWPIDLSGRRTLVWGRRKNFGKSIDNYVEKYEDKAVEALVVYAKAYNTVLEKYAEALSGPKNVEKAVDIFRDLTKALNSSDREYYMMRKRPSVYNNKEAYPTKLLIRDENLAVQTKARKQPLKRPRFDRVDRQDMKDHREGKNVTATKLKETFGFTDITYGEYVTSQQRQDHTNYAFDAFHDLAETLGLDPKDISLGGELHLSFGALGRGRHAAHYSPNHPHPRGGTVPVINLTNTHGDGTVSHEWIHALDQALRGRGHDKQVNIFVSLLKRQLMSPEAIEKEVDQFLKGSRFWKGGGHTRRTTMANARYTIDRWLRALSDFAKTGVLSYAVSSGTTSFKRQADVLGKDYWGNDKELLARAGEAYVYDTMEGADTYLVSDWVSDGKVTGATHRGTPYPVGEERTDFNSYLKDMLDNIQWDKKGPYFKDDYIPAVQLEAADMVVKLQKIKDELVEREAQIKKEEAEKRRKAEEDRVQAAKDAEKAKADKEQAMMDDLKRQLEEATPPPLEDQIDGMDESELEDLFDNVAAEAEEEGQDQFYEESKEQPEPGSPGVKLADSVLAHMKTGKDLTWQELFKLADAAFGGTQAEGTYTPKMAYDAAEVAASRHIQESTPIDLKPEHVIKNLKLIDGMLPTQTKRTAEQEEFQQFSTPHPYAYVFNWLANTRQGDIVLEPSAGTGNIAMFPRMDGANVVVNELGDFRAELLKAQGYETYTENAEQLNNILPDDIKPTVVLMNPPFSSTAGRMKGKRDPMIGAVHVEQALKRLQPGGRLVALVGKGMADQMAVPRKWWDKIKSDYTVRVNIGVSGKGYVKFGTTFDSQILVIDNTGPTTDKIITGKVEDIAEIPALLEEVRNERVYPGEQFKDQQGQQTTAEPGSSGTRPADVVLPPADELGVREREGRPAGERPPGRGEYGAEPAGGEARVGDGIPDRGRDQRRPAAPGQRSERLGAGEGGPGAAGGATRQDVTDNTGVPDPVTAKSLVKDAAKHGVKGIDEALTGLSEIFGGKKLKSFPAGFDEESYAKAKPHFERSLKEFIAAGKSIKEFIRFIIDNFGIGIKPYIVRFVGEYKEDKANPTKPDEAISESTDVVVSDNRAAEEELTDNIFEGYRPYVTLEGAQSHPGKLVESAAMAAVSPPQTNYSPNLPQNIIDEGRLSDAQLEVVILAGTAHSLKLPNEKRRGFMIGDGTGLGKGREIAGIIMDNMRRGRKKAVWISEKSSLFEDAKRDYGEKEGIGGNEKDLFNLADWKSTEIPQRTEGILFTTYATLRSKGSQKKDPLGAIISGKSRLEQLSEWLGEDFDGVIAFDEAHNMGNNQDQKGAMGTKKATSTAIAGLELQDKFPNARVLYVSATSATEVANLGYADRLGLWGKGMPFNDRAHFTQEVAHGGVAAMELIAKDMKAMGGYLARSLSYEDVTYGMLEHEVTPEQTLMYNEMASAWQIVLQNMEKALLATGITKMDEHGRPKALNGQAKARKMSIFYGSMQRFFGQILTATQMPTALDSIEKEIAKGNAVVLQLVNTGEAAQERAVAKMRIENLDIEDLDVTPREIIMNYLQNSFPVEQYEEYIDKSGNTKSDMVRDSEGEPVINKEAVKMREELLTRLGALRTPDNPLDQIINHFGPDAVAEVTGRSRRFVRRPGEKTKEQKLSEKTARADADAFMNDQKQILIFSDKGGTGRSYHASLLAKNQRRRIHYLIQPGWRADKAVQGFGRTHRSNEASAPHYMLVTTNIKAQRRFLSSVARRLDQLGALTKGQRQTGSQGIFTAEFNLETEYAEQALYALFRDLKDGEIETLTLDKVERMMGMQVTDETGAITEKGIPTVPRFLNRLMAFDIGTMDIVFDAFYQRLEDAVENARLNGTLDVGVENIMAEHINKVHEQPVHIDKDTGAITRYVQLQLEDPVRFFTFDDMLARTLGVDKPPLFFARNKRSGNIFAFLTGRRKTKKSGAVVDQYRRLGVTKDEHIEKSGVGEPGGYQFNKGYEQIEDMNEARAIWDKNIETAPKTKSYERHMITGAVLPIWNRLRGDVKIMRVQTDEGERMIGRLIPAKHLDETLRRLGASKAKPKMSKEKFLEKVQQGSTLHLANGWRISKRRVSNEDRIEISGPEMADIETLEGEGVFNERIGYTTRFFIPVGAKELDVFTKVTEFREVVDVTEPTTSHGSGATMYSNPVGLVVSETIKNIGKIAKEGQPIERLVKIPFYVFGSIDEHGKWSPPDLMKRAGGAATAALDTAAESVYEKMPWVKTLVENVKVGMIDKYGLPEDYRIRDKQRESEERKLLFKAKDFLNEMRHRGIESKEAVVLQSMLTGETIANEQWEDLAIEIRQAIDEMGQEAVLLGLISQKSYEKNKGSYLHRVYLKHESQKGKLGTWVGNFMAGKRKKLYGGEMKARGLDMAVTPEKLTAMMPKGWWGQQQAKGKADTALVGLEFHVFDRMDTKKGEAKGKLPKIKERVYWPVDQDIPAKFRGWEKRGRWEVRLTRGNKAILWRDFTKSERESMGEILDARYTVAKTFMLLGHDLATGRFYRDIARNEAWTLNHEPDPETEGAWTNPRQSGATYTDVEWVHVPITMIPKTGTKQWGELADKWVRKEIWIDLNQLDKMNNPSTWRKIMSQWKANKTARSPVVHMNNVMSNLLFMDMADIRMRDLYTGITEWIKKGEHYNDALEHGAFGGSFAEHELRREILDPILRDVEADIRAQAEKGSDDVENVSDVMWKMLNSIYRGVRNVDNSMVAAYQIEDEIFRMATYMRRIELGDDSATAAMIALDQFLDYSIHAPWVNLAKGTMLPFIGYTYRAVPVIAKSLAARPWKLAKYITVAYVANALAYMVDPGDEDEERRSMREEIGGRTWLGVPRMLRMPYRDDYDNPVFLDIRRWIPAGDVFDTNQGQLGFIPAPLQFGGPLMLAAELALNKIAFTGKEIINTDTDTATEKASKVAGWFWKSWMPSAPWIPKSWYWDKIGNALTGARDPAGRSYSIGQAAASAIGIKVQPHDVKLGFEYHGRRLDKTKSQLNFLSKQNYKDWKRGLKTFKEYNREKVALDKKMKNLMLKAGEIFDKAAPSE